ncbi:MAG: hypothetical protein EZS28_033921 [Streblomastix strix]|uniref:Uncharacterized protein n=1 Tax=Streblomastix strix TaxID=222440 RepID=A0A5J4UJZ2_9EUKA|nr:MAG: hypothetical protein EZS28_033921 [Streblomastix strix]
MLLLILISIPIELVNNYYNYFLDAEDENLFDFERIRVKCGAIFYSFCEEDDRIRSDEDDQGNQDYEDCYDNDYANGCSICVYVQQLYESGCELEVECGVQLFALIDSLTFDELSFILFGVEGQIQFCFEGDEDDYYEVDLLLRLELFLFVDLLKLYIQSSL